MEKDSTQDLQLPLDTGAASSKHSYGPLCEEHLVSGGHLIKRPVGVQEELLLGILA